MFDSELGLVSHHLCPYVQRAVITLLEKDIPHQRIYNAASIKANACSGELAKKYSQEIERHMHSNDGVGQDDEEKALEW